MILHVIAAKYISDYKIEVAFNNREQGIADLSDALKGPVFEPLKEKTFFSQFKVDPELETLTWPNGADLAPEYIYFQAFKNDRALQELFQEWGYIT